MNVSLSRWLVGLLLIAPFWPPSPATSAQGGEPARQFLVALRERGYYDVALDYLEQMESSDLAPDGFKQSLLYEKAITLIENANTLRDEQDRERALDDAQSAMRQFLQEHQQHELAGSAQSRLANLLVGRARQKVQASRAAGEQQRISEAQSLYEQAHEMFAASQAELREQLSAMPQLIPEQDTELRDRQTRLRNEYLQAQLLTAAVLEESSESLPAGSAERQQALAKAVAEYGEIYEKYWKTPTYRKKVAGLYARLYQGRAQQKAGEHEGALTCLKEVLEVDSDHDEVRKLKTTALQLAIQCWLDDSQGKYAEAVQRGDGWLKRARPHESETAPWLELKLQLARAHQQLAKQLQRESPQNRRARTSLESARQLAAQVARLPGPSQPAAQQLLAQLGGSAVREAERPEPTTFAAAREQGKEALIAEQTANLVLQKAPERLRNETDEQAKLELQRQVAEAEKRASASRAESAARFQLALELADEETPLEEVNDVRYFLAYLGYTQASYYDAAVLGAFVATRHPTDPRALQAAKIAHAAYAQLYGQSKSSDKQFEQDGLISIAELILRHWPDEPEGKDALKALIPLMINAGEFEKAEQYLAKIPQDSGARAEAELQTGKALWSAYLRGMREVRSWESEGVPAGADIDARRAELRGVEQRAQQTLAQGIERLRESGEGNAEIAAAVLALANIYLDADQPEQAIDLLEDEQIGPLQLVAQQQQAARTPGFAAETYKTALRAYVSSLPTSKEPGKAMERARGMMSGLKDASDDTQEGQNRLIAIYYNLALDLRRQLELAESKPEANRVTLAKGIETFVEQVSNDAQELDVVFWAAETYSALAEQRLLGDKLTPSAKRLHQKAGDTYAALLRRGGQSSEGLSPQMTAQVRLRLAMTTRKMGQYKQTIDTFEQMLLEANNKLNVQIEAARTYQEWAGASKADLYRLAMIGGRLNNETKTNTIWGWIKIARLTAGKEPFRDAFHEVRFNLALCRYLYAIKQPGETRSAELLRAYRDIEITYKLYRDLGGEKWEPAYGKLLRAIQRRLGREETGLAAVKGNAPPASSRQTDK